MMEFLENVDEFFKVFIEDGLGRFVFCHLPFWSLIYFIAWNFLAYLGPYVIFGVVFFILPPLIFGGILFEIYKMDEVRTFRRFKIAIPIYLGILLITVGIPKLYYGWFLDMVSNRDVDKIYVGFIKYWWIFFNHLQPFKDVEVPTDLYQYRFVSLQFLLWAVSLLGTSVIFYIFYDTDKDEQKKIQQEIEKEAQEEVRNAQLTKERRIRDEALRLKNEEIARAKQVEEDAKQRKIDETKAKDPWDSGFL